MLFVAAHPFCKGSGSAVYYCSMSGVAIRGLDGLSKAPYRDPSISPRKEPAAGQARSGRDYPVVEGVITYTHLWVDASGCTHLTECTMAGLDKVGYSGTPQYVRLFDGKALPVKSVVFTQQFGDNPWHHPPSVQVVICLSGSWFVRTSDGSERTFNPGDVLFQDNVAAHPTLCATDGSKDELGDHAGQHFSGAVGGSPCNQLVLQVERKPATGKPGSL